MFRIQILNGLSRNNGKARRRLRLLDVLTGLGLEVLLARCELLLGGVSRCSRRRRRVLLLLLLLDRAVGAFDNRQNRGFVDHRLFSLNDLLLILDRQLLVLNRTRHNLLVLGHWTRRIDRNARGFVVESGAACLWHVMSVAIDRISNRLLRVHGHLWCVARFAVNEMLARYLRACGGSKKQSADASNFEKSRHRLFLWSDTD